MTAWQPIGVRWTIGDVSPFGFEALRLSIWGPWRRFGPRAAYAVCVNSVPLERARARTGMVPAPVLWRDATGAFPDFLRPHIDEAKAEGAGWKLAPLRVFPDRRELSFDNDCILWDLPGAIRAWLEREDDDPRRCVIAEDVRPCFGQFAGPCGPEPRNAGIRGLPGGFDLEATIREILSEWPSGSPPSRTSRGSRSRPSRAPAPLGWWRWTR